MTIAELAPTTANLEADAEAELPDLTESDLTESETVMLRTRAISQDLIEVAAGESVVGFLELAGGVWVALCGPVYSWATEVGQHLDPDEAVLTLFANGTRPAAPTGLPRGCGPRLFREENCAPDRCSS